MIICQTEDVRDRVIDKLNTIGAYMYGYGDSIVPNPEDCTERYLAKSRLSVWKVHTIYECAPIISEYNYDYLYLYDLDRKTEDMMRTTIGNKCRNITAYIITGVGEDSESDDDYYSDESS